MAQQEIQSNLKEIIQRRDKKSPKLIELQVVGRPIITQNSDSTFSITFMDDCLANVTVKSVINESNSHLEFSTNPYIRQQEERIKRSSEDITIIPIYVLTLMRSLSEYYQLDKLNMKIMECPIKFNYKSQRKILRQAIGMDDTKGDLILYYALFLRGWYSGVPYNQTLGIQNNKNLALFFNLLFPNIMNDYEVVSRFSKIRSDLMEMIFWIAPKLAVVYIQWVIDTQLLNIDPDVYSHGAIRSLVAKGSPKVNNFSPTHFKKEGTEHFEKYIMDVADHLNGGIFYDKYNELADAYYKIYRVGEEYKIQVSTIDLDLITCDIKDKEFIYTYGNGTW